MLWCLRDAIADQDMASLRRTEAAANRQRHEDRHMGAFSRIYPTQNPVRQALYAQALQVAAAAFAGSMKAKAHSTIERLQVGKSDCGPAASTVATGRQAVLQQVKPALPAALLSAGWHLPAPPFVRWLHLSRAAKDSLLQLHQTTACPVSSSALSPSQSCAFPPEAVASSRLRLGAKVLAPLSLLLNVHKHQKQGTLVPSRQHSASFRCCMPAVSIRAGSRRPRRPTESRDGAHSDLCFSAKVSPPLALLTIYIPTASIPLAGAEAPAARCPGGQDDG